MADLEAIIEALSWEVPAAGWNTWTDTSQLEPFPVWLTPPGMSPLRRIETISPDDFVSHLNEFNEPDNRLSREEVIEVSVRFINKWFLRGVANGVEEFWDVDNAPEVLDAKPPQPPELEAREATELEADRFILEGHIG